VTGITRGFGSRPGGKREVMDDIARAAETLARARRLRIISREAIARSRRLRAERLAIIKQARAVRDRASAYEPHRGLAR
jgi:hypothetical protein